MSRRSMTTKVFVGSLPANTTVEELRKLFSPYGDISECDIANRCGFLHLEDRELAMKAIDELNNTQFMGGRISVEMGRTKARRGGDGGPPSWGGGGKMRGGMNSMGRDLGPYARDYGGRGGGPGRAGGGYDRDYYDRNSVLTHIRNDDRPYNSYGNQHYGDMSQSPGGYYSRYSVDNRRPVPSYQSNDGYAMGGGGARTLSGATYGDNRRMGAGSTMYDDRGSSGMYEERRAPVMSTGLIAERRPQVINQGISPSNRMDNYGMEYTRRDSGQSGQPKQLMSVGGYGDRGGSGHVTGGGYPSYSSSQNGSGGYQMPASSYGDSRQTSSSGYDSHSAYGLSTAVYGSSSGGYGLTAQGSGAGGYGDSYGQRGNYDSAYPALPQQRGGYAESYEQPSNYHY